MIENEAAAPVEQSAAELAVPKPLLVDDVLKEIRQAGKREKTWRDHGDTIVDRYENRKTPRQQYNILYSNVQTIKPAAYSNTPVPDVRSRNETKNPVTEAAAEMLQRALRTAQDLWGFDLPVESALLDRLLPGRGVLRVRLEIDEITLRPKVYPAYVHWRDFRFGAARQWSELPWVAFRHYLDRAEMARRFPDHAENVNYNAKRYCDPDEKKTASANNAEKDAADCAEVWEVWWKESRKVLFAVPGYESFLETLDDPLRLQQFFPVPEWLTANPTNDDMQPNPDFDQYESQATELTHISDRISTLVQRIKINGFYDSASPQLAELLQSPDGTMLPVGATAVAGMAAGNVQQSVGYLPIRDMMQALQQLYVAREAVKTEIYEISGISDIVRGSSNPNETATAQRIKGNFATLRLDDLRKDVATFCRDALRLMAELMAEHFPAEVLVEMSGMVIAPDLLQQVMQALQNDAARSFSVDIETDSTIAADEAAEVEATTKMLTGVTQLMGALAPAVQGGMLPVDAARDVILAVVGQMRNGRKIQAAFERLGEQPPAQQPLPLPADGNAAAMQPGVMPQPAPAEMQSLPVQAPFQ